MSSSRRSRAPLASKFEILLVRSWLTSSATGVATEFEVPEPVGLNLALSTALDRIDSGRRARAMASLACTRRYIQVVGSSIAHRHQERRDGGVPNLIEGLTFGIGLRDDLINHALGSLVRGRSESR